MNLEQQRIRAQVEYDNMLPDETEPTLRERLEETNFVDIHERILECDLATIREYYDTIKGKDKDFTNALIDYYLLKKTYEAEKEALKSFPDIVRNTKYELDIAEERLIEMFLLAFKDPEAKQRAVEYFIDNELEV